MRPIDLNSISINDYSSEDAPGWLALLNTLRMHPLSLDQFADREARFARPPIFTRRVCKRDGEIVAIGQLTSSPYVPRGFAKLDLVVSAQFRSAGVGSKLLEALEYEAQRQSLSGLYCEQVDQNEECMDWLQKRGFEIFTKRRESRLVLNDKSDVLPSAAGLASPFRIASLGESNLDDEQFLQFIGSRLQETPDLEDLPAWTTEQLEAIFLRSAVAPRDWIVLALAADEPIGVGVMHEQGPDAYIYFVGVLRRFRGASVGIAILCTLLNSAKRRGCKAVNIDNMEENIPAIRLTERLGFKPVTTRIELRKSLPAQSAR